MILRSNRTILDVLSLLGATFAFAALVLSNYLSTSAVDDPQKQQNHT